jgi:prophage maintenance system killer protein
VAFLRLNGLRVKWQQEDALEFIVQIAEGRHGVPAIAEWLRQNTAPMSS